jgi:hypothetical protein
MGIWQEEQLQDLPFSWRKTAKSVVALLSINGGSSQHRIAWASGTLAEKSCCRSGEGAMLLSACLAKLHHAMTFHLQ